MCLFIIVFICPCFLLRITPLSIGVWNEAASLPPPLETELTTDYIKNAVEGSTGGFYDPPKIGNIPAVIEFTIVAIIPHLLHEKGDVYSVFFTAEKVATWQKGFVAYVDPSNLSMTVAYSDETSDRGQGRTVLVKGMHFLFPTCRPSGLPLGEVRLSTDIASACGFF